ncbi:MAG: Rpn family recombination-promoting nuclease/putative transposase, partial [Okeania sp. SIO2H7]|nr:Rpn family recombination-promoting nuclease/putative transposase [Okeania sp. SIO2H7]
MRFISPKTDLGFKKIFGSPQSKEILISFLNAILYEGKPTIKDLEIIYPYCSLKIEGMKETYLDAQAFLSSGQKAIVEMQVLNVPTIEKRILYDAVKFYSLPIDKGEKYSPSNPLIALTITDFIMFDDSEEIISRFVLKEKERLTNYSESDLELVFVELPKFYKKLEELENEKDKWLFFLKHNDEFSEVPAEFEKSPVFKKAFYNATKAHLTNEELWVLFRQEIFIKDLLGSRKLAFKKGVEQGKAE